MQIIRVQTLHLQWNLEPRQGAALRRVNLLPRTNLQMLLKFLKLV
jgi:hypothetical protein